MKSLKTPESVSCPLLVVLLVADDEDDDVCLDSWTLEDFVTAAEFDDSGRCEENVSLMVVMCSDDVAMSREDWKRSRL